MPDAQTASQQELKQARTTDSSSSEGGGEIKTLMGRVEPYIQEALPGIIGKDRFVSTCLTTLRNNPELMECDQRSLLGALVQCAQLGLTPDTLGQAYLVPFRDKDRPKKRVQLIIGYRGMIDLARRSGELQSIQAAVVKESDEFDYKLGLDEKLDHTPSLHDRADEDVKAAYCIARFKDGGHHIEVMGIDEIKSVANQSGSKGSWSTPWKEHFEEMAKKTVIRRAFKLLPVSTELKQDIERDEKVIELDDTKDRPVLEEEYVESTDEDDNTDTTVTADQQYEKYGPESFENTSMLDEVSLSLRLDDFRENYRVAQSVARTLNELHGADITVRAEHKKLIADIELFREENDF